MITKLQVLFWHLRYFIKNIPCWHLKGLNSAIAFRFTDARHPRVVGVCTKCQLMFKDMSDYPVKYKKVS